jgi:hypothetical protein
MLVSEILSEAKSVLGRCDEASTFRRITDAVRLANNQGKFDISLGQMDICACDGCVTLPADVGTVLAVNSGGFPTLIRDQWYQYHANGTGSECDTPWNYTDELGMVSTFKDPSAPVKLVAVVENAADSNCLIRAFGWDENGKRIYTEGAGGILEDGFLVPTVYGYSVPNPDAPDIARIDRIQKVATNGFIKLIAVDSATLETHTMIGYYQPWELNPSYRRIRTPNRNWIRIKYRKKDLEIRASSDWINIENREALLLLIKAVQFRLSNQIDQARAYETEGIRLLSNEAEALRPPSLSGPQIVWNTGIPASENDTLFF